MPRATVVTIGFPLGVSGHSPRFSPDGSWLAYLRNTGSDYHVQVTPLPAGSGGAVDLASDGSYLTAMTWSRDSAEVIYYDDTAIRAVPVGGGIGRQVVAAFAAVGPDLSPDGGSLVYGVNGGTMRLADLRPTPPLESDLGIAGSSPRFSPDGATIAFSSGGKLSVLDVATRTVTELLDARNDFGGVDWFSDGRRLLVGTDRGPEIVTLGPPLTRTLVKDVFAVLDVDLSPNDASIAYGVNGAPEISVLTGF